MEIDSSISLLTSEATSRRLLEPGQDNPGGENECNGNASPSSPPAGGTRLASITGLLMSQKPPTTISPPVPSDGDQGPPPSLTRAVRFDDDSAPQQLGRTGSFGAVSAALHRRPGPAAAGTGTGAVTGAGAKTPATGAISDTDLRRFVFHHPRAKRMVSGLRVRAFTRQAFVSSFTVGLALGSVVAIVLKILNDLTLRMLYN